jgi:hypothetical protein
MTKAQKLAEAEACTRRAQRDAFTAQIRLAVVTEKLLAAETAEAKRQRALVESAIKRMVKNGAIRSGDYAGEFTLTAQFIADPTLIPLALTKTIFRARLARNQRTKIRL